MHPKTGLPSEGLLGLSSPRPGSNRNGSLENPRRLKIKDIQCGGVEENGTSRFSLPMVGSSPCAHDAVVAVNDKTGSPSWAVIELFRELEAAAYRIRLGLLHCG
jgi:hypothetical protein